MEVHTITKTCIEDGYFIIKNFHLFDNALYLYDEKNRVVLISEETTTFHGWQVDQIGGMVKVTIPEFLNLRIGTVIHATRSYFKKPILNKNNLAIKSIVQFNHGSNEVSRDVNSIAFHLGVKKEEVSFISIYYPVGFECIYFGNLTSLGLGILNVDSNKYELVAKGKGCFVLISKDNKPFSLPNGSRFVVGYYPNELNYSDYWHILSQDDPITVSKRDLGRNLITLDTKENDNLTISNSGVFFNGFSVDTEKSKGDSLVIKKPVNFKGHIYGYSLTHLPWDKRLSPDPMIHNRYDPTISYLRVPISKKFLLVNLPFDCKQVEIVEVFLQELNLLNCALFNESSFSPNYFIQKTTEMGSAKYALDSSTKGRVFSNFTSLDLVLPETFHLLSFDHVIVGFRKNPNIVVCNDRLLLGDKVKVVTDIEDLSYSEMITLKGFEGVITSKLEVISKQDVVSLFYVDILGRVFLFPETSLELLERPQPKLPERFYVQEYEDLQGIIVPDKNKGVNLIQELK